MFKTSRHPIYRKNLLRTAGLFLLFALLCSLFYIPCYVYVKNLNKTISMEHHLHNLESNMSMLDASLDTILNAEYTMTNTGTSLYGYLSRKEIEDTKLLATRKYLSNYFAPYSFISNVGIVIDGEPALDRYMLFYARNPLEYYNYLYCAAEDFWDSISGNYCVIPSTPFYSTILKNYDAVTIACQLSRLNNTYLFVIIPWTVFTTCFPGTICCRNAG